MIVNQMGFPGYFLIVMPTSSSGAKRQRHTGRPGARLRRRFAGGLCTMKITDLDPLEYRSAVRALPEPGARVACRTSTSTSAWTAVTSVIDYVAAHLRSRLGKRRSSPTARWPRRRWCATSARVHGPALRLRRTASPKMIPFEDRHDAGPRPTSWTRSCDDSEEGLRRRRGRARHHRTWRSRSKAWRATPANTPAAW